MTTTTKRPREPSDDATVARVTGTIDATISHDVTRYTWWSSHEGSSTQGDRRFSSKRMALMYVAKRNSEELEQALQLMQPPKTWHDIFPEPAGGSSSDIPNWYALRPNAPFALVDDFLDLPDAGLVEYCDTMANAFSRLKVPKGTTFRYAPRDSGLVEADELLTILRRVGGPPHEEHVHRQLLLMADIAGFD